MPVKLKVITVGDSTTTGGKVISGARTVFCQGKEVALIGSQVVCPLCGTTGSILQTHSYNVFAENKQVCIEGDTVACGCPPGSNRLIASPGTLEFIGYDDGSVGAQVTLTQVEKTDSGASQTPSVADTPAGQSFAAAQGSESGGKTLHIGLFFDGVGRNIEQDAPENRLSNIARLFRAYPIVEANTLYTRYHRIYIPGLGTPFQETAEEKLQGFMDRYLESILDDIKDQPTEQLKDASQSKISGASLKDILIEKKEDLLSPKEYRKMMREFTLNGVVRAGIEAVPWLRDSEFMAYKMVTGGDTRLHSVRARFEKACEGTRNIDDIPLKKISVSVFGFDMGATLAREFIDIMLNNVCEKGDDGQPAWQGVPVQIVFTGLFDCSRDTPLSSDNGLDYAASAMDFLPGMAAKAVGTVGQLFGRKYLEHMSPLPDAVKKSLHLVAAHERRPWRCVYRTGRNEYDHQELLMPGCSEDIGGGIRPDEQKPSAELCRVSLRRMYQAAISAGVPFVDLETLRKTSATVASYFSMRDGVKNRSVAQWVAQYQQAVPGKTLSYTAMNHHLDSYFEWLGRQHYEYKSELRRLDDLRSAALLSAGAGMGMLGIPSPEARKAGAEIDRDVATLKKHWGWLNDVALEARQLLTARQHPIPRVYLDNVVLPARARALLFIECGTAGFDSKPLPKMRYNAPDELYAWFMHDIQRSERINDGFFSVRWMEPRN